MPDEHPPCKHDTTIGSLTSDVKHLTTRDAELHAAVNKITVAVESIKDEQSKLSASIGMQMQATNSLLKMQAEQLATLLQQYTKIQNAVTEESKAIGAMETKLSGMEKRLEATEKVNETQNVQLRHLIKFRYVVYALAAAISILIAVLGGITTVLEILGIKENRAMVQQSTIRGTDHKPPTERQP